MITFSEAKKCFFDRAAVQKMIGRKTADALSKGANAIKLTSQRSMRYKPKDVHSAAGTPPYAHKGGRGPLLRNKTLAWFDMDTMTAVVGATKLKGSKSAIPVPKLHEFGGTRTLKRVRKKGRGGRPPGPWIYTNKPPRQVKKGPRAGYVFEEQQVASVTYPSRTYIRPALMKSLPKLAPMWGTATVQTTA
jgi:hypothetical protein